MAAARRSTYGQEPGPSRPRPNTMIPKEIRELYNEGVELSREQMLALIESNDKASAKASAKTDAKTFIRKWANDKGVKLEDYVDEMFEEFETRFNPSNLSEYDIDALKKFNHALNPAVFKQLSPAEQVEMLETHRLGLHDRKSVIDKAKNVFKITAFNIAWYAAKGIALGPKAVATTLQNFDELKNIGQCAATLGAWWLQTNAITFLYTNLAVMSTMAASQCNTTATAGGRKARKMSKTRKMRKARKMSKSHK
jgi:hypothetical protein